MNEPKRKTLGVAFGSGGIRGLAHVGVLQSLIRHDIPIDYIAGTSIGAWVGGLYALKKNIFLLEDATVGYQKEKLGALIEFTTKGGVIRGKKMRKFLHTWFEGNNFSDTQLPFTAVAADLVSGEEVLLNEGELELAVQASMAIPVMFKPIEHQGKLLVDGGIVNPVPDDVVRKMGADVVLAINLDTFTHIGDFSPETVTLRNTAGRSFFLVRHYLAQYCQNDSDIIVEPDIELHGPRVWKEYFTNAKLQQIVQAGEKAMEEKIPELQQCLNSI